MFYCLTAKISAKFIIFQVGAVIKNIAEFQSKVGVLRFTLFQELYFRELIHIFWIHFTWIYENQVFNGSSNCCRYQENLTNKHTHTHTHTHIKLQLTQSFQELVLNLKRAPYIQYALTSNFVKLTISSNVALQHVTEAFPDM